MKKDLQTQMLKFEQSADIKFIALTEIVLMVNLIATPPYNLIPLIIDLQRN